MGITVDVSEVIAFGHEVSAKALLLGPLLEAAVVQAGAQCTATAQSLAPVDTGALRGSIHPEMTGGGVNASVEVSSGVDYAIYQEFGTYKMAARPHMIPAHQATEGSFIAAVEAIQIF